jgi:hypothetical protein
MVKDSNIVNYYLIFPNGKYLLGEMKKDKKYLKEYVCHNTHTFTKKEGYEILLKTIKNHPTKLELLKVETENGKTYTIDKFFSILQYCYKIK